MIVPREYIAIRQAADRVAEIFGGSELATNARRDFRGIDGRSWDTVVDARGLTFDLEWKRSGSLGIVGPAIRWITTARSRLPPGVIPLLAVPHMGDAALRHCEQAVVPWLD